MPVQNNNFPLLSCHLLSPLPPPPLPTPYCLFLFLIIHPTLLLLFLLHIPSFCFIIFSFCAYLLSFSFLSFWYILLCLAPSPSPFNHTPCFLSLLSPHYPPSLFVHLYLRVIFRLLRLCSLFFSSSIFSCCYYYFRPLLLSHMLMGPRHESVTNTLFIFSCKQITTQMKVTTNIDVSLMLSDQHYPHSHCLKITTGPPPSCTNTISSDQSYIRFQTVWTFLWLSLNMSKPNFKLAPVLVISNITVFVSSSQQRGASSTTKL
jgi:hypothetical protein